MSFDCSTITWSCYQLSSMVKNGRIVFDNIIQRSYVWEKARKSCFIESLVLGVPIPATYAKRYDDGSGKRNSNVYDMLDGKQRLSTVKQFINDEFSLTNLKPVHYYNELTDEEETYDLSGRIFSELPEGLQEKIKNARISVVFFDNLTENDEHELFKRLNNGKPLSAKSRTLASSKDIKKLLSLGSHKVFDEMLTEKSRDNKNQASIVMKIWAMLNKDINEVSFESKKFNPMIEDTILTDAEANEIVNILNYIYDVHEELKEVNSKVAKKLYTEVNLVSFIPYFKKLLKEGIDTKMAAEWILDFFEENGSKTKEYTDASTSGVSKNSNIVIRNNEIGKNYHNFFCKDMVE